MKVFVRGQGNVTLDPGDFVAKGGQASVYAKGDVAYKLFTDPTAMVAVGKLQELAEIRDPDVVRPEALVQDDATGRAIGYTMRYLRDARPLASLIPPAYRKRHGLDARVFLELVERLRILFEAVHAADARIVDANELNFLVDTTHTRIFAIDTDSYETRSYPASAVTPAILDPRALGPDGTPTFSEGSDWFAFAVLAFELFVGAHPYRGTHPDYGTLEARMKASVSAFDSRVTLPPAALPIDAIPSGYRQYLCAVLEDGLREAPPPAIGTAYSPVRAPIVSRPVPGHGGGGLVLDASVTLPSPVRALHETADGALRVECDGGLYDLEGRRLATLSHPRRGLALSPKSARPVVVEDGPSGLRLRDVLTNTGIEPPGRLDDVTVGGGRLYGRIGDSLVELALLEIGGGVIVAPKTVARVLPRATRLFPGLAVQSLLGATYLSLLEGRSGARQVRVPELDGRTVVEACADRGVAVLLVAAPAGYDRLTVRVAPDGAHHDARWSRDVDPDLPDLAVLDRGLCLARREATSLEVYDASPGSLARRTIEDPRLATLRLARHGGAALAFGGDVVYRLSSRA